MITEGQMSSQINLSSYGITSTVEKLIINKCLYQSTLRPPEVHILYVHFNYTSAFALRIWELMICVVCGRPQNFVRNTKGYNSRKTSQISSGS